MRTYDLNRMTRRDREALLSRAGVDLTAPLGRARVIVERVRKGGDAALLACAREFDSFEGDGLRLSREELAAAAARVPSPLMRAMRLCKSRIEEFHRRQSFAEFEYRDEAGLFGQKVVPLDRVGVYVPGGTASYASSVLMACVPARVAGVGEIAMCTPSRDGKVGDAVLAAAGMCSVDEVYCVGGAHSIAAMAYGTETIRRVQKIVGPGGAIVSAAKLLVRNDCPIDSLAGPSEVLIVADGRANPRIIAAEMLAQLEHDPLARAVLVATSERLMARAEDALRSMIASARRREVLTRSSEDGAAFVLAKDVSQAISFSNEYAPEHLVIDVASPRTAMKGVKNAGSVFLGRYSSVAFGDYCSGPNHIIPTGGTASADSSLSTYDFMKVVPYQVLSASGASGLAPAVELMAAAEGLPGHAQAAAMRRRSKR